MKWTSEENKDMTIDEYANIVRVDLLLYIVVELEFDACCFLIVVIIVY